MKKSTDAKTRRASPPSSSYMTDDQFARPGGARPIPLQTRLKGDGCDVDISSAPSSIHKHQDAISYAPNVAPLGSPPRLSSVSTRRHDYYTTHQIAPLKPSDVVPTATYMESGQRWMEREEAVSLRDAMDMMGIREGIKNGTRTEDDLYNAALNEASELVWEHQHGIKPRQADGPYRYRPHLQKNSYAHARTSTIGVNRHEVARPSSDVDSPSDSDMLAEGNDLSQAHKQVLSANQSAAGTRTSLKPRPLGGVPVSMRRTSLKRNISGEVERPFSGDQIWEEPETSTSGVSVSTSRQSFDNRPKAVPTISDEASRKLYNRIDIYRNPPSQSRNPQYTKNTPSLQSKSELAGERKNGIEVRSNDIRAATSRKLKDRSSKLPEPSAVSNSPGRPIVSFNANWKAPDEYADITTAQAPKSKAQAPSSFHHVGVPSIVVEGDGPSQLRENVRSGMPSATVAKSKEAENRPSPGSDVPTIILNESSGSNPVPVIVTPDEKPVGSVRPLPSRTNPGRSQRPQDNRPRDNRPPRPRSDGRVNATCHECGFAIEGRCIALATQERFHPQCFRCFSCGTGLEAMEISPEPDDVRAERIERIRRRDAGEVLEELEGTTMAEDGDDRLRFYCHLDWHELFAPRCKHCTTPIMGEHIVALGQHWHYGHFFCAECGDPFENGMTHIEKDGYAWCLKCQTQRTERRAPKCQKCKMAVVGQYIKALGSDWHEHCFRCAECSGSFDDGQVFPKEVLGSTVVLCTACRARELKA
ncbi:LIM domain protein [Drechmeria coniospora]|uniref:LIM domain protein n=1 Tax=Drechmeria coniospora TaxID=98403 RepID=A0A151GFX3_DRECN|nr:LIM domain protein [Drechmeria coniospora]KYK55966.1 LIM domain protein [Drechmeria coniospora]